MNHTETQSTAETSDPPGISISQGARQRLLSRRGEPLFYADWVRSVFIHYEVEPAMLQRVVPFPLDLREGKAYVSLVAFTMERMRPRVGGKLGALLLRPISHHGFLNVRAYVRCDGEPGIYFLAEWLSNRWAVPLGPVTFGLPYRFGKLNYQARGLQAASPFEASSGGTVRGEVIGDHARLAYEAKLPGGQNFEPCNEGSRDEFLLERYTAFTRWGRKSRLFRIWHEPWPQVPIDVEVCENSLLTINWPWFKEAKQMGGNYSPGVFGVWMGRPERRVFSF